MHPKKKKKVPYKSGSRIAPGHVMANEVRDDRTFGGCLSGMGNAVPCDKSAGNRRTKHKGFPTKFTTKARSDQGSVTSI